MTTMIRLPWHWRLRRWLGFDSTRRGVLYIPNEIQTHPTPRTPQAEQDVFLNLLIDHLTAPIQPPHRPRLYRFRHFIGDDRVRGYDRHWNARSLMPIILRGPADAAPYITP